MRTADVVIGANWGDEGKGLLTDYLAAPYGKDALVVRFCGGAQAGHTVTAPDGRRHVFNHFGSGSFCGSSTYLSRFFICNPIMFLAEARRLEKIGLKPKVFVDPSAPVTTPYDMMINQMIEESRGASRHGSCGLGIGETVERQQHVRYALRIADLYDVSVLEAKLKLIREEWVPERLQKLGIASIPPAWKEHIASSGVVLAFMRDVSAFLGQVRPSTLSVVASARHVIFEGAQGLLLDQNHKWFPHVTRSNTGIRNASSLAKEAGIRVVNAYYASRCYATRHGAGPMPHELAEKPYEKIVDLTNVPNPHQGTLRFGWLDLDLLRKSIRHDLSHAVGVVAVVPSLAMTCLDQIDDEAHFIAGGLKKRGAVDHFLAEATTVVSSTKILTSYGPTRETIRTFLHAAPDRSEKRSNVSETFAYAPLALSSCASDCVG